MYLSEERLKREEEINKVVEEHKSRGLEVHQINVDEYEGIFKRPTSHQVDMYKKAIQKKDLGSDRLFAKGCLIYPSKEEFDIVIEEYPGLSLNIVNELLEIVKVVAETSRKKL